MDEKGKNMDNTRIWLERLYERLARDPLPKIMYVGPVGRRFYNPPFSALQICYVTAGVFKGLRVGEGRHTIGMDEIAVLNTHFGVYTSDNPGAESWDLYIDTTNEPLFVELARMPLFGKWRVASHERLLAAFRTVAARTGTAAPAHWRYVTRGPASPISVSKASDPAMPAFLKAALYELVAILLDETQGKHAPRMSVSVQRAADFIAARYSDSRLGVSAIAKAASLSPSQLRRLFRREMGLTPMKFLVGMRIMQGRVLLEQTSLRIGEVAANVGFVDPLYFSRLFRAASGCSPQAYRRQRSRPRK